MISGAQATPAADAVTVFSPRCQERGLARGNADSVNGGDGDYSGRSPVVFFAGRKNFSHFLKI
jgi:hypothetical protein